MSDSGTTVTLKALWPCLLTAVLCAVILPVVHAQSIDSIDPPAGHRSERLEIIGSGFGAQAGTVMVAGFTAITTTWEDDKVVAYVPERAALGATLVELLPAGGGSATAPLNVFARTYPGRAAWRFAVEGDYLLHAPGARDSESPMYISDLGGRLYALDAGGALLWVVDALRGQVGGGGEGPVAVADNGTVFVAVNPLGEDVDLVAVSPAGEILWVYSDPGAWTFAAGPDIGPDGNVYAVFQGPGGAGVGAISFTPDGTVRWNNKGTPAIVEHGGIGAELAFGPALAGGPVDRLFLTTDNDGNRHVYAFGIDDGTQHWAVPAAINDVFEGQTAVAASPTAGLVYLTESNGWGIQSFRALDGARDWRYSPGIAAYASNPAAGPDGAAYFGWEAGNFGAVGPDGLERWQYQASDGSINGAPRVTPDGKIVLMYGFASFQSGWIKGLDTITGALAWQYDFAPTGNANLLPDAPVRITSDSRRAYIPLKVSGSNPDPKFSYVYAIVVDGFDLAVSPRATTATAGSVLPYRIEIENFASQSATPDVWVEVSGPSGGAARLALGPLSQSLAPDERRTHRARLTIPAAAPAGGPYTARVYAGEYPDTHAASATFQFWVEP